jgi:hypothetical protein
MYTHKKKVVDIGTKVSGEDRAIVSKAYDFMTKGKLWTLNAGISKAQESYTARVSLQLKDIDTLPTYRDVVDPTYIKQVLKQIGTVNEKTFPAK